MITTWKQTHLTVHFIYRYKSVRTILKIHIKRRKWLYDGLQMVFGDTNTLQVFRQKGRCCHVCLFNTKCRGKYFIDRLVSVHWINAHASNTLYCVVDIWQMCQSRVYVIVWIPSIEHIMQMTEFFLRLCRYHIEIKIHSSTVAL